MAQTHPRSWSARQHFAWRASTVLLAYLAALVGIGVLVPAMPDSVQAPITWVLEKIGPGALLVWFPAAILSLAFFFASLIKRNPQAQFVIELFIAIAVALFTPIY